MKEKFESGSPESENEEKESRERQEGSIEVSKIVDFMREKMDSNIEYLKSIRDGNYDTSFTDPWGIRERIIKEVAYANGNSDFIWQSMLNMLESATGEKFKELREELRNKHSDQIQKLKSEIERNLDNLVDQIIRRQRR